MSDSSFLRNKFFLGYIIVYTVSFVSLANIDSYQIEEAVAVMVLFGLIFPALAYWLSSPASPLMTFKKATGRDMIFLIIYFVMATIYLAIGLKI